ncbi:hypothetical protein MAL08_20000 (plasmid) [Leptospira noguchii]|uniref:hypothetical protein n=1 Tax=Leptospira noguchii TaxID=28182 RepID=UPI0002BFBF2A|nr:hypothetical protein [Leptospira noguchii]EMI71704.1 hypothetical protein LEP1GSC072_1092 [Leptospira noguchii str. Bonito]EMS83518.1 hypothetical protein LEP1GSC073_1727 [Leptospira noguchii str. Cascata]UOG40029.1 hypothetical protein MAL08_20000 [Leptospira noguchii]
MSEKEDQKKKNDEKKKENPPEKKLDVRAQLKVYRDSADESNEDGKEKLQG